MEIELHWRLFPNPYAVADRLPTPPERMVPIARSVELRTFADEDLFAYLCVHGAGHSWFCLKWLADICALLSTRRNDEILHLFRAACGKGAGNAAAQALVLCRRLLGLKLPEELTATFKARPTVRLLEWFTLNAATPKRSARPSRSERTLGSLSSFLLGSDWRYWPAELKCLGICETDVLTVPLPKRFFSSTRCAGAALGLAAGQAPRRSNARLAAGQLRGG